MGNPFIPKKKYVTKNGGKSSPITFCLMVALVLRNHGTADSLRKAARKFIDYLPYENHTTMKAIARTEDDQAVLAAFYGMASKISSLFGIMPDEDFLPGLWEPQSMDTKQLALLLDQILEEDLSKAELLDEVSFLQDQIPEHQKHYLKPILTSKNPTKETKKVLANLRKENDAR